MLPTYATEDIMGNLQSQKYARLAALVIVCYDSCMFCYIFTDDDKALNILYVMAVITMDREVSYSVRNKSITTDQAL